MKKLITLTAAAACLAAPALAGSMTISFANDDGTTAVMTFNDDGTATAEGAEGSFAYTWDEATHTLCGDATGEGEVCATLEDTGKEPAVGDTAGYTLNTGDKGTATITAMAE